ncbi:PREDICTED: transmembrane protein 229B-like [Gekko japonicus]|uniref:Transmembrane protein 229B-like n=1 Tax=Gekko japonicus TaxID=146911 RepID=A0ABM1KKN6_GEKJA|nr:PREDICTED: transmembrane protein 229B-like [Gekko japonicus]XP_015284259.1 PREDICTED: transmembrane protein 229B-like [Gekko japonicus]
MGNAGEPLSPLCRWYIYALHGYLAEIGFTATCNLLAHWDWRLLGVASVWVLFIYGTFGMILEHLYLRLRCRCNLVVRGFLYTLCIYAWEFCIGYILRCFNACPWDYSGYRHNFMGLITLEYCPLWFVGSLLLERVVVHTLRLRLDETWEPKEYPSPNSEQKRLWKEE